MRSLVVDDDLIARLLLTELLAEYGPCDAAADGAEAVRACRFAIQRSRPYDLICLDIMMPQMDGHQALKKIRALELEYQIPSDKKSKIIMISALLDKLNKQQAEDADCDDYLTKPVENQLFQNSLRHLGLIP